MSNEKNIGRFHLSLIYSLSITSCSLLSKGSKLRQRHILCHVVEHYFYRHADFDVSIVYIHKIGQQPWTFIHFHLGNVVRNLILDRGKIGLMKNHPRVHFPATTEFFPSETA